MECKQMDALFRSFQEENGLDQKRLDLERIWGLGVKCMCLPIL
jgi:hypothetical protein